MDKISQRNTTTCEGAFGPAEVYNRYYRDEQWLVRTAGKTTRSGWP